MNFIIQKHLIEVTQPFLVFNFAFANNAQLFGDQKMNMYEIRLNQTKHSSVMPHIMNNSRKLLIILLF